MEVAWKGNCLAGSRERGNTRSTRSPVRISAAGAACGEALQWLWREFWLGFSSATIRCHGASVYGYNCSSTEFIPLEKGSRPEDHGRVSTSPRNYLPKRLAWSAVRPRM